MGRPSELLSSVPRLCLNRLEVAASLGVSVNTVDQMVRDGRLPRPRRWNSRKFWITSEIAAYLSEWPIDGEEEAESARQDDEDWRASA